MKILILGGTVFLGRHLVESALARGHDVTLFNRGRSGADLFPALEQLRGDRTGDVSALRGRSWDAVIDPSGYTPQTVRAPLEALADRIEHYTLVSSVSVYSEFALDEIDERVAVKSLTDNELAEGERLVRSKGGAAPSFGPLYGGLKAHCEWAAEDELPGRLLTVRPGLIVGPHDYSDRFTYWVHRVAEGGSVLAPGRPERSIRVIDVRDLADWMVRMAEDRTTGVYNATGAGGHTMGVYLEQCKATSASNATFTWVDEDFLAEREIGPWLQLPLWLPEESNGFFAVTNDKAIAAGLEFRPLRETIRDTLAWDRERSSKSGWKTGLEPELEAELLRSYSARASSVD
ncbi:MAG: NAD-dependent epimerase/dehydratase family protein [Acidobacteriota bacterium]